jgi:hypothetical protein
MKDIPQASDEFVNLWIGCADRWRGVFPTKRRCDCDRTFEANAGSLQAKEISLFQIRQHYSGGKGEADVPH